jgi:hypothetical protein
MNILVVPDLHGKEIWKQAVGYKSWDHVVFIGDYVDAFKLMDHDIYQNLDDIIELKQKNYKSVTLLWGNHDIQYRYLNNNYYRCSGFRYSYSLRLEDTFKKNDTLFKYAHRIDNFLFSHAGIHSGWWEKTEPCREEFNIIHLPIQDQIHLLARTRYEEVLGAVGYLRGGSNKNGGPLWCDQDEVNYPSDSFEGVVQIVGHSQVGKVLKKKNVDWWYTDCLDTVNEFLYIEGREVKTFTL